MDGTENFTDRKEKELAQSLEECSFLYGEEFTKIAERPREIAAAKYSVENAKQNTPADAAKTADNAPAAEEKTTRTRIHVDLGESKSGKVTPAPDGTAKSLTAEKKNKK